MATIARSLVTSSRQKTTCSWPSRSMVANSSSSDFDEDVVALDFHREAVDRASGIVEAFTARHIVRPGVQGAGHHRAVELAFAERATAMLAGIVYRVERAADVEQRDLSSIRLHGLALAGRQVRGLRHLHQRSHAATRIRIVRWSQVLVHVE